MTDHDAALGSAANPVGPPGTYAGADDDGPTDADLAATLPHTVRAIGQSTEYPVCETCGEPVAVVDDVWTHDPGWPTDAELAERFESLGDLINPADVPALVRAGVEVWSWGYDSDDPDLFTTLDIGDLWAFEGDRSEPTGDAAVVESWAPFRAILPAPDTKLYRLADVDGNIISGPMSAADLATFAAPDDADLRQHPAD